ncbi:MAG: hypothetical protein IKX44_01130 [Prevotella sp.]|nr:hypothetical protein [Prevotella sp.]
MKHLSWALYAITTAVLAAGCSHHDDEEDFTIELSLLEQAYYIKEADAIQPQWLQAEIRENPYLKILRSENAHEMYLLEYPESGMFKRYQDNQFQDVTTQELDKLVETYSPWTCTHIYSFPLYPGDEEWDFDKYSVGQIKEKLRLSAHLLKTMRTPDLVEVCLDYQYMSDFIAYDEMQTGFDNLCIEFNGYDELLRRQDFVQTMLKKLYTHWHKMEKVKLLSEIEKGRYGFQCALFPLILAQDRSLKQFEKKGLRQMIDMSLANATTEQAEPAMFGRINQIQWLYLYARIIQRQGGFVFKDEEERKRFEQFARTCTSNPGILAIFTEDLQQRMISFLSRIR